MPKISVVVPVHNVASCLENTVASVMSQTFRDIEILLVENKSDDGSYEKCLELTAEDKRIKVMRLEASGLSLARNAGIDAAVSEYVSFIDGDDIIEADMLQVLYDSMMKYGADLASCDYILDFPDKESVCRYNVTGETRFMSSAEMLYELLQEKICSSACVMLCRKSLFDHVRFPVGRYYEDHAATYLLVDAAKNGCVHVGRTMYHYIQRSDSISHRPEFKKKYDFALSSLERLEFIHAYPGFAENQKKEIMLNDIRIYIDNIIGAIALVTNDEEKKTLEELKDRGNVILTYKVATGRRKERLLRMKYLWKLFYKQHR